MSNFVINRIEAGAKEQALHRRSRRPSCGCAGPASQGLQVTDRAVKRIRVAMAKEGVSPKKAACASA